MPFDFHFLRPLWLLALLPLGLLLWRLLRADRDRDVWRGLVDSHLLPRLLSDAGEAASRVPLALLGLGWLMVVLALAGPAWERLPEPLYQARQFRVLVIDLSPSMNVTDQAPSRLVRARFKLLDLLRESPEGQTALLAYGAEPYVVAPLTSDVETIAAQVPNLDTSLLPVFGARHEGRVLDQAGELLRQAGAPDGQVILLTDGLDYPVAAGEAAERLRAQGYRLSVLGFGTAEGGPVVGPDGALLKDARGAIQVARLDAGALRGLAAAGGGRYLVAGPGDADIRALAPDPPAVAAGRGEESQAQAERWREEGPWLLLVLLPLAVLAFRRGWLAPPLLLVCLLPPTDAHAVSWDELWLRPDQRATRLLERGESERAAGLFERPDWRAAARYRAQDYDQALQLLERMEGADAAYNRGNALARLGRLDDAVAAYDQTLAARPADQDARYNRALVQSLLDQQRQQSQSQDRDEQATDSDQPGDSPQQGQAEQRAESDPQQGETSGADGAAGEQADSTQQPQQQSAADAQEQERIAGEQADPRESGEPAQASGQPSQQAVDSGAPERPSAGSEAQPPQTAGSQAGGERQQDAAEPSPVQRPDGQNAQQPQDGGDARTAGSPADPGDAAEPSRGSAQGAGAEDRASDDGAQTADDVGSVAHREASPEPDPDGQPADAATGGPDQVGSGGRPPGRTDPAAADKRAARADAPGRSDLLSERPASAGGGNGEGTAPRIDPEDRQAIEQMLRRVDDDPGGLLRQRFLLQHLRRNGQLP